MKKLSLTSVVVCAFAFTVLSACGGGGGAGVTVLQPTTAVIKLATTDNGTKPANTIITGYDVLISLPAGVTVKSTTAPPQTNDGVVTATGAATGASIAAVYSAATSTLSGTVRILIAKADGFSAGEFVTVNCDIAAGHYPKTTDFPQPTFFAASGYDTKQNSTVDLTNDLTLTSTVVVN
jgi:hypothetical protein